MQYPGCYDWYNSNKESLIQSDSDDINSESWFFA